MDNNTALNIKQSLTQEVSGPEKRDQYLSFVGAGELCALPIKRVEEIIDPMPVSIVPETPDYVLGVSNLRGEVIPIIDFGGLVGTDKKQDSNRRCVILVTVSHQDQAQRLGLLVDRVEAVFDLYEENHEAAPSFGFAIPNDYVKGMVKQECGFIALLELEKLLALENLQGTKKSTLNNQENTRNL